MIVLEIVLLLGGIALSFYLVFPFISVLVSLQCKEKKVEKAAKQLDLACIITVYGTNVRLVNPLVESLLSQFYSNYLIYVVADDCEVRDIEGNAQTIILKPDSRLNSKVKSFRFAVEHFRRKHDAVVIFDPDNIPKRGFLRVINDYLHHFKAVQGCRKAKNLDTIYACADATGEIYKNFTERLVPFSLGSSPTIAGSGIALETSLFEEYLTHKDITSRLDRSAIIVEDKMMQNIIVNKGLQIAYAKEAIIYDEKVTTAGQVQHQRSRWLYSYFANLSHALRLIKNGLRHVDINRVILGVTTSSPPMFILLFGSLLFAGISFFINKWLFSSLTIGLIIFTANIFLVLWLAQAPHEIWRALWGMPMFVFNQFLALFKMNLSRKKWLVTPNENVLSLKDIEKER